MAKKFTQQEIEKQVNRVGGQLIGIYCGTDTKIQFQCPLCNNIFLRTPYDVIHNRSIYCIKCRYQKLSKQNRLTQQEAIQKSEKLGIVLIGQYTKNNIKTQWQCPKCQDIFDRTPNKVWDRQSFYCNRCNYPYKFLTQEEAEQKSLAVGMKLIGKYNGSNKKTEFECSKCKQLFNTIPSRVWKRHTQSCHHCNDPKIGDKFGKLTIIKIYPSKYGGSTILSQCDCGREWSGYAGQVISGRTQSCGNCQLKRNGRMTSFKALELEKIINNLGYKTKHNYEIWRNGLFNIKSDIVLLNDKIVIEYDEWYWHGHKQKEDKVRLRKIHSLGWKTLQIKDSGNLPAQKRLHKTIIDLINGAKSRTITLRGWGQGETRFNSSGE